MSTPSRAKVLPEPEPISLKQLRSVIPAHCFERSYVRSFAYVLKDVILVSVLMYLGGCIDQIPYLSIRMLAWLMYWFAMGVVSTGIWVIAHECGHQAFSPSLVVNDAVGCVLHTILLVPYWSWKYSHAQHHANANSMERDSVFVPRTDLTVNLKKKSRPSSLQRLITLARMLLAGWLMYLLINSASSKVEGKKKKSTGIFGFLEKWNSHFNPFCNLWRSRGQKIGVVASDAALMVWAWILYRASMRYGLLAVVKHYFIPYLWVNFWLVTITYLQHTDWTVPKYYNEKWTWLRGALGTVDRDFGLLNVLHHHIGDTHVLHHIFSQIPHYHAQEATKALLDSHLIDEYYLFDPTPWYSALWRSYTQCWYVKHDQPVTWFESFKAKMN